MSHLAPSYDGGFHSSSAAASKKAPALSPLAFFKEQQRTRASLQRRGDQIHFLNSKLSLELRALEQELRTDRLAQQEYLKQDARFEARKGELRKRIETQHEFTAHFDEQIGPFERRYEQLQHSVDGLHADAKSKYDRAVQLLVDKLDYNPAFKRWNDPF